MAIHHPLFLETRPNTLKIYSSRNLHQLAKHLGLGSVHLCGCSMGASVARDFAIAHPEMTKSLILVSAGAGSVNRDLFLESLEVIATNLEHKGIEVLVQDFEKNTTRISFKAKDPRGFEEFLRYVQERDAMACAHLARQVIAKRKTVFELEPDLRALHIPTLIMAGDRDTPCIEPSLLMNRWLPHSGLLILPACGHTPISKSRVSSIFMLPNFSLPSKQVNGLVGHPDAQFKQNGNA